MFYLKTLTLLALLIMTLVQLASFGFNLLDAFRSKATAFAPTSVVTARVTDVVIPPETLDPSQRPVNSGHVVVEYRDPAGKTARQELARVNSAGPTEYFSKKVGDEVRIEIPDPASGKTSTNERFFWKERSGNAAFFGGLLLAAAVVFRFL